ncbi:hypothetical protein GCM10023221_04620 [Luteimicrobium xylanilyticum]|uniref:ESAT-6-like protein n=1 Tax=Luteimicrobium xylanilyticum TaxID=1133546 RepID=A0A5P9QA02_9MICO|nr:WXG100 family type VII secretion target [Luteimicrobium xylanilyticum]QFU97245.1 hypothetical protein KDY119_00739 [Luteimicrobium xylanilyticum]
MAGMIGLDVEQVNALGDKLNHGAQEIKELVQKLNAALNGVQWKGTDGDKFRDEWHHQHVTQLNKVADALQHAGQTAKKNAQNQQQTSSAL